MTIETELKGGGQVMAGLHQRHEWEIPVPSAKLDFSTLDAFQLHALRIGTKKLRYSGEFFANLFGARKAHAFLSAVSEVQEGLGDINDITIAHRMLDKLSNDFPTHEEVIAFIRVAIATDLSKKHKKLRNRIKSLSKHAIFWIEQA
ncbi:MAG: CHAD domain-containing protein [Gallionella sp.]